ncbi:MAG: hypothetical protein WBD30_00555, partial [Bacteroidota bacterium]
NIAGTASSYFHGSDVHIDDVSLISAPEDLVWIVATGPFDMAAGDTVKLTIAVVAGDDDADYYSNIWEAKKLFDAQFNGPTAPPAPSLSAVAEEGSVTLYWDDGPETVADPSTGEVDFEGYKIYRSEDGGVTWGTRITDAQGRTYGYVPVAQFDLINNIKGADPKNPLAWLGTDSGLRHSWVDSNVVDGITYSYTIVSYDRGTETLFSLESTRGDGPQVKNFVTAIPLPTATGRIPAALQSLGQTAGSGDGSVGIEVIDAAALRTTPYRLTLEGTPASTFSVMRLDGSNTIVYSSSPVNNMDLAVADGFRVSVVSENRIGGIKSITEEGGGNVVGSGNLSSDGSWYASFTENAQADTAARSASYAIRFDGSGTTAYGWGIQGSTAQYTVPFSVWNTTSGSQVVFEIRDLNNDNQWQEGELIYITRVPYPSPAPAPGSPNPATQIQEFAYQILIANAPSDTAVRPPAEGTAVLIQSYNALRDGDEFEFQFTPDRFDASAVDLSQIRVVPNPYIVTSRYETLQNVRQIRFMYLPPRCTIRVFTLSGALVKTLEHDDDVGSISWNLVTDWDQAVAFGVYVYVAEDPEGNSHIGKFGLIK